MGDDAPPPSEPPPTPPPVVEIERIPSKPEWIEKGGRGPGESRTK